MSRVMAQGTFDILHPGHLHYLKESAKLGNELYVVIGRDSRVGERKNLFMNEDARRQIVDALKIVDATVLGSEGQIFDTVERINPDIVTLGYDQKYNVDELESELEECGFPATRVTRVEAYDPESHTRIYSSSDIKEILGKFHDEGGQSAVPPDYRY